MKFKHARRVLSSVLALVMLLSLLPVAAFSAENDGAPAAQADETNDGLKLNKTATLEDDGTYTIKLEAYATGEVTTTTTVEKEPVPADIIMILDQSGSMDEDMKGIPTDTYNLATVTNAGINQGSYYYKVGDQYYKVTATKELVSTSQEYVGDDGKTYQADDLSYSWTRKFDGKEYNTARPFVSSSLSTWTRTHNKVLIATYFWYVNDDTNEESRKAMSASGARSNFSEAYDVAPYTVEFHNDDAPGGGDTDGDDLRYVAARYIAVSYKEVNVYRYTYTYVDASGKTVTIGSSKTGSEAEVDAANASIDLYVQDTTKGTRLDGLKYAANKFIDSIEATGVNHRIAVVGFASDGYEHEDLGTLNWENTELFVGSDQYNYNDGNTGNAYAAAHYGEALQDVSTVDGKRKVAASIDALGHSGATFPQWGFTMAQGIYDNSNSTYIKEDGTEGTRNRIVIFFTDGYPGYNYENPDTAEANATVSKSNTLKKTYDADVYCVACIESLEAGSDADTYLKDVSSDNTYQQAITAEALDAFFKMIETEVTDTTVTTSVSLTENAVLVDELSNYFTVPADFSVEQNVTLQTAKHMGYESFATPTGVTGLTVTERTDSQNNVTGINVSGFDYLANKVYKTDSGTSITPYGSKLVVTIRGLLAKDEAATGVYVDTNTTASGIWDKDNNDQWAEIKAFNMPHTLLDKKLFVLDYAKKTPLDVYDATKVDSAKDSVFSKVDETSTSLTEHYGKVGTSDGLSYTPITTLWDGWDIFYALGKDNDKGDMNTKNIWSKVSVLPANNVYYEDTFVTNTETGTVGIVYSPDGWETVSEGSNTGDASNDEHGWITSMDDDATYSDGTVATGSAGATATFSFTGTGVDIYSRTDMTTGLVVAKLYEGTDTTATAKLKKSLTVDNLAQSGTYYQIPTVSFTGLDHGTYTIKLTVASTDKVTGDKRSTYYLDGIRVYNPLSTEQEQEDVVREGYGDEIGASFQSVRDILLEAKSFENGAENVSGAVFIDYNPETSAEEDTATTAKIGTYEDYGPKNEVYLAKDQAIAINVGTEVSKLSVGLKAPEGATTAQVTNGANTSTIEINAASDQYYVIAPNTDGYVIIKNTGDNLLSVTKLKMSGDAVANKFSVDVDTMMSYANSFDSLPVVTYTLMDQEPESPDTEEPQEPEQPEEPEQPGEGGDVVIENPDEPEQGDVVIENPEEPTPEKPSTPVSDSWIAELIRAIRKIFRP